MSFIILLGQVIEPLKALKQHVMWVRYWFSSQSLPISLKCLKLDPDRRLHNTGNNRLDFQVAAPNLGRSLPKSHNNNTNNNNNNNNNNNKNKNKKNKKKKKNKEKK